MVTQAESVSEKPARKDGEISIPQIQSPAFDAHCFTQAGLLNTENARCTTADSMRLLFPGAMVGNDGKDISFQAPPTAQGGQSDKSILESGTASPQEKALAAGRLYNTLPKDGNGRAHITLKDGDKDREFEISVRQVKPGVSVNALFTKDEGGQDRPVLRWVDRNGQIEEQKDGSGKNVGFRSKYATNNMAESTVAKFADSGTPPAGRDPEVPPRRGGEVPPRRGGEVPPRRGGELPPQEERPPVTGDTAPRIVARYGSSQTIYTPRRQEGGAFGSQPPRGEGSPVYLPDHTIQKFMQNPVEAGYAAAAGDPSTPHGKFGTMFRITEMNNDKFFKDMTGMTKDQWTAKWGDAYKQKYGFDLTGVHFRVVDTGSAIKGTGRVDLAANVGTAHTAQMEQFNTPHTKQRYSMEVLDSRIDKMAGQMTAGAERPGRGERPVAYERPRSRSYNAAESDNRGRIPGEQAVVRRTGDVTPGEERERQPGDPKATRSLVDWHRFYRSQTRNNNCLPATLSMMHADWVKGSPSSDGELRHFEGVAGVGQSGGYTGSEKDIARQAASQIPGLKTQAYQSLDRQTLGRELDKHLDAGHTAIVGIKSPYSSGNHYIYVAGKDSNGQYIIGDSGRRGGGILGQTISRDDLLNRMMARNGGSRMVAGWTDSATPATQLATTAAGRYAFAQRNQYAANGDRPPADERPTIVRTADRGTERVEKPATPAEGSERRQIKLRDAVVDIPKNLDPSKPIHFMTYFNGFGGNHSQEFRSKKLDEAMKDAPPNTVFISARWQDNENSRDPSHRNFNMRETLNQVFTGVPELRRTGLKEGDSLGLAGFSAGYNAVGKVLADRQLASKVNNIVMLDAPSSAVRSYVNDNLQSFVDGSKRLTMVAGDWRAGDYREMASSLTSQLKRMGINDTKGLRFGYTRDSHGEIPAKWFRKAAF